MKKSLFVFKFLLLNYLFTYICQPAVAELNREIQENIPNISDINFPETNAELLTQSSPQPSEDGNNQESSEKDADINLDVVGEQDIVPESTPVYVIEKEEIQKQGANNVADILKKTPGFAVNDVGHAADIHTGTYYRGQSINQSTFLINGRPLGSNVNTYHGGTDLNSIPVESIERIELSSGASNILYGSGFGGVVNIITKEGSLTPKLNSAVEFGSLNFNNQQFSYSGAANSVKYSFGFERNFIDNRYKVPKASINRGADGYLFNADSSASSYYGNIAFDLNSRNTLNLDVGKISSRKGLIYFGFPLQKDRLDHDGLNLGLSWKAKLGAGDNSNLTTTIGYTQDYFSTYGPTVSGGREFYRTGILDTQILSARIDHEFKTAPSNKLRWGLDFKNTNLGSEVESTLPSRISLNQEENRNLTNTALFAVNTWDISKQLQIDLGLRQSFDSKFSSYLNPSVGLRYGVTPKIAFRGSWTGGQRNPGLDQLYTYDTVHGWLPNPDLEPETGSSWTAGIDFNLSKNFTGQVTYFGSSLDNRLGIVSGKWQNIGLVDTNGLEAALQLKISPTWKTFFNYTYTDAQIKTGTEKGLQLSMIPYSVAQAGIGYEKNGWQANLFATYYSGGRRAFFLNSGDKNTDFSPSFFNLDFTTRVPVSRNLGLTFYLENILGEKYERVNRTYSPGLTFRVGLSSSL
jgi:vitamin B12 transporter